MSQSGKKVTGISFLLISVLSFVLFFSNSSELRWTMVNVNNTLMQGDAHVIQVNNGKTILIDTGYPGPATEKLLPFLQKNSIKHFDHVFITHPHKDHYGGLRPLLAAGISMDDIFFNLPDKELCDREIPWGCDYNDVLKMQQELRASNVAIKEAKQGQLFQLDKDTAIRILYAFDGIHTPVGRTGINDLSLIMLLQHKSRRILFTGDLNKKIGGYISQFPDAIRADILKVPHHGTEGLAPDIFFAAVNPKIAMVPSPKHLWLSKRSERPRNWFQQHGIPVYVNGISGDIQVVMTGDDFSVIEEHFAGQHSN